MSQKLIRHQNWNITKTEMSPKLICHQNWNVSKSKMSPKLKFHQNWIVTKTKVSSKLKCYQNWNVSKHYNVLKNFNQNSRDGHWIPWSCWVNSVPQYLNKQTNKGNNVSLIVTTDSKKSTLKKHSQLITLLIKHC